MIDNISDKTANTQLVQLYGAIIISVLIVLGFILNLYEAYATHDQHSIDTLGILVDNAIMIVVGYWLGSSMGSQKKDTMLLNAQSPPLLETENIEKTSVSMPPPKAID